MERPTATPRKILIASTGSNGDVLPFFGLAQRLRAAGHDVLVAASDNYAPPARALGLPFAIVGPPWDEAQLRVTFERILAEKAPLAQLARVIEAIVESERAAVAELRALSREVDVVVYPPLFVAAVAAARAEGTPHISVHFAPIHRGTGYGPTGDDLGELLNTAAWWLGARLLRRTTDAPLNTIVREAGLAPWTDILLEASHSTLLDIVAVSPHVMTKDPGWHSQTVVTGYWFVDESDFRPDPALAAFMRTTSPAARGRHRPTFAPSGLTSRFMAEEPPVVIGFGSMMGLDAARTTATILEVASGLGRRVVLQSGWAGLGASELPANVHVAPYVPHSWLFERAACVVHHGGAGTTAAAFRAGVPQTIVWHLGDQPVWGKRVADLGVGLTPCVHRDLDARWLHATIDRMLRDRVMQARARALGRAVREEDGLGEAVTAIERAMRAPRRAPGETEKRLEEASAGA
ncbi:MAG TPA: glycosyltransferase [Polyangiaceae bacterium]|nr:glycosyltransferase [Polyangiaceae bacterium]